MEDVTSNVLISENKTIEAKIVVAIGSKTFFAYSVVVIFMIGHTNFILEKWAIEYIILNTTIE